MEFHFNVQNAKALKLLGEIKRRSVSAQLMGLLAQRLMTGIKTRTAEGTDFEGKPFKHYSESYRLYRSEHGRPVDKVDLNFKGQMLGAMTYRVNSPLESEIFFADAQQGAKAHGHFYGYPPHGLPARKFFAASVEDLEAMMKMVEKWVIQGQLQGDLE